MKTPHHSQDELKQKALEEKLKTHIQREFTLGEKVISLLKQKKELEGNLREQQQAQLKLEENLQKLGKAKKHVEHKFQQSEKTLQDRQSRLKTRSRIISEDEEHSRETLERLQRTIHGLQTKLKTVDTQKVEERTLLLQKLRKLRQREKLQRQKLEKIVQQRDMIERRLRSVVKKYKQLSHAYHTEKKQHEAQQAQVHEEQISREARIELLRDESQVNEENLLKDIESLKQTKAELEEKLSRVEQKHPGTSWALDADLLQVIEKQNQHIQNLKDKAHQRSTFLRTENDGLREEIEEMSNSQEKVKWENQMLESSLRDLQTDLTEYIQLKNKFEEVQKEKEDFEMLFQRRLRFFEDRESGGENGEQIPEGRAETQEAAAETSSQLLEASHEAPRLFFKRLIPTKSRLIGWLNVSKPKLLLVVLMLIVVVLSVQVYRLIPWRYLRPASLSETVEPVELPEMPELDALNIEGKLRTVNPQSLHLRQPASPASAKRRTSEAAAPIKVPVKKSSSQELSIKATPPPQKQSRAPNRKRAFERSAKPVETAPTKIYVQLSSVQAKTFLHQPQIPFPTIENNSILRRHSKQKHASFRR